MYAPDVYETNETLGDYTELRKRADELGFATVHNALDKLEELMNAQEPR